MAELDKSPVMRRLNAGATTHHFKKFSFAKYQQSVQNYSQSTPDICQVKLIQKKFERLNFFTHRKKKSTIHHFLSNLSKIVKSVKPIMFYGDGSFASSGKGQCSIPCKWVKRECKFYFKTFVVNEFQTSQVCPTWNTHLSNVKKDLRNGNHNYVQGMNYCSSQTYHSHRYKSRDDVGCTNMFRKSCKQYHVILDSPWSNVALSQWDESADIHVFKSKFWSWDTCHICVHMHSLPSDSSKRDHLQSTMICFLNWTFT